MNFGEHVREKVTQEVFGEQEQFPISSKVFWGTGTVPQSLKSFWGTGTGTMFLNFFWGTGIRIMFLKKTLLGELGNTVLKKILVNMLAWCRSFRARNQVNLKPTHVVIVDYSFIHSFHSINTRAFWRIVYKRWDLSHAGGVFLDSLSDVHVPHNMR